MPISVSVRAVRHAQSNNIETGVWLGVPMTPITALKTSANGYVDNEY